MSHGPSSVDAWSYLQYEQHLYIWSLLPDLILFNTMHGLLFFSYFSRLCLLEWWWAQESGEKYVTCTDAKWWVAIYQRQFVACDIITKYNCNCWHAQMFFTNCIVSALCLHGHRMLVVWWAYPQLQMIWRNDIKMYIYIFISNEKISTERVYSSPDDAIIARPINNDSGNVFCLVATSHYLNQCWIVSWTLRNNFYWNLNKNIIIIIEENEFENAVCKMMVILFRLRYVNLLWPSDTIWWHRSGEYYLR